MRAKEGGPKEHDMQKWPREINIVSYAPGLSTLSYPSLSRSLHRHSSVAQGHLDHPSSIIPVCLVPTLRLLPPSTPFWPYGTHSSRMVLIHSFYMPKPSQYSLIRSTLQLPFYSSSTKLLKHFISRTFTFLLSALPIPHASALYNAVGAIIPSYRHCLALSPVLYCSAHFSALSTLCTPGSFCVPHPFHILHQLPLEIPGI